VSRKKAEPKIERITQDVLKTILHYDPLTGVFTWLERPATTSRQRAWNTRYAGKVAGYPWKDAQSNTTYRVIRIFDWPYLAHRIAVLYMTGEWPSDHTDHKDLDGLNNRWLNIRVATRSQNFGNRPIGKRNTSGAKGVRPHGRKWVAECAGKYLGSFSTFDEARDAYAHAALLRFGEFARMS
jgi:hypothetical protein